MYGVPEQWPHIRALYQQAGFTHTGHTEIVYLARVEDLPRPASAPLAGLSVRRSVGINGCRLSAVLGQDVIGYIEVETFDEGERLTRTAGWAEVGQPAGQPSRTGARASGHGCSGRRPTGSAGRVDRLLDYAWLEGTDPGGISYEDYRAFLPAVGFRELTRTQRGWTAGFRRSRAGEDRRVDVLSSPILLRPSDLDRSRPSPTLRLTEDPSVPFWGFHAPRGASWLPICRAQQAATGRRPGPPY